MYSYPEISVLEIASIILDNIRTAKESMMTRDHDHTSFQPTMKKINFLEKRAAWQVQFSDILHGIFSSYCNKQRYYKFVV